MKKALVAVSVAVLLVLGYMLYRESERITIVSVTVINEYGRPSAGTVVLLREKEKGLLRRLIFTNELGKADFLDLPPGEYEVWALGDAANCHNPMTVVKLKGVTTYIEFNLGLRVINNGGAQIILKLP